jgi:DNA recombination protein RmuC
LEVSGLTNRIDFAEQAASPGIGEDRGRRPDVVVSLPGAKSIAIDAKVPLTAYLDAAAIPAGAGGDQSRERERLVAQHAKAVRAHVDALASRRYWSGLELSPEFTVMFIPTESLLGEALRADPTLLEHALARGVAPATPSGLFALLKTVATIWQQATVAQEARDLLDLGRELHSRLGALGTRVGKLGRTLTSAVRDYNDVVGSLERRVLVTTRRFEAFDATTLAAAPIDSESAQVRHLSAPELTPERAPERAAEPRASPGGAARFPWGGEG